jgi:hypothetical protein
MSSRGGYPTDGGHRRSWGWFRRALDRPSSRLTCDLGDSGWVTATLTGQTSVPGVSIAGTWANPRASSSPAAGEAFAAAIAINGDFDDDDLRCSATDQHHVPQWALSWASLTASRMFFQL